MNRDKGSLFGLKQVNINLENVICVGGKTKLIPGEITISTTGKNFTFKNFPKLTVVPFTYLAHEVRDRYFSSAQNNAAQAGRESQSFTNAMDKIARLAQMKEEGILTEEEVQIQKQQLLNH